MISVCCVFLSTILFRNTRAWLLTLQLSSCGCFCFLDRSIDGRDKTVKFWDTRTSTPAAVVNLCERAYSMDTKGAMMVVATADRKVRR